MAAIAAVMAGLAVLVAYSRREVRRAEEAFPPTGRLLELDGWTAHAVESGEGPPVLLIHGADGVGLCWSDNVVPMLSRDHRVVALDRPGHGYSTLPRGGRPDVALDVSLIREAARALGLVRPIVVGHSYGGTVALAWALDHPDEVAGLVLLAPVASFPWRVPVRIFRLAGVPVVGRILTDALVVPVGRLVLPVFARRGFDPMPVPEAYTALARALYLRPSQFRALAAEYATLAGDVAMLAPRFGELSVPCELLGASGDLVTVPAHHVRPLAEALGKTADELNDAGHELMWSRPDAVAAAVRRVETASR
jgi:pimeloyl-ACP methyl ester carboxylesterase